MVEQEAVLQRMKSIKEGLFDGDGKVQATSLAGSKQSTITVLQLVYGQGSEQLRRFILDWKPQGNRDLPGNASYDHRVTRLIDSVLASAEADLVAGLTKSRAVLAKGEVRT